MGGFLQAIVSGYGGYRLFPEKVVFQKPRLPPQTTNMTLHGRYFGINWFKLRRSDFNERHIK